MNTVFLLMAQYGGRPVIPLDMVVKDYFSHLTAESMTRKINAGEIALPLVRMDDSQKTAKGIHLTDLAAYLDERVETARKECRQLNGL